MGDKSKAASNKEDRTQAVIDTLSKLLIPIVLFGLGVWFNISTSKHQEKEQTQQRFTDSARQFHIQSHDDKQRRTDRVEAYIKHLSSTNPRERELAIQVMASLDTDVFDPMIIVLMAQYLIAREGPTDLRNKLTVILLRAAHSNDSSVRIAAMASIPNTPDIPIRANDSKQDREAATIINKRLNSERGVTSIPYGISGMTFPNTVVHDSTHGPSHDFPAPHDIGP